MQSLFKSDLFYNLKFLEMSFTYLELLQTDLSLSGQILQATSDDIFLIKFGRQHFEILFFIRSPEQS